jgi:hypothetical protein
MAHPDNRRIVEETERGVTEFAYHETSPIEGRLVSPSVRPLPTALAAEVHGADIF